jgi:hypothetical protein
MPRHHPCAHINCIKVLPLRSIRHSGGVLCIFHREELRDSVSHMFKCWFKDDTLIGFSPADYTPLGEGDSRSAVGEEEQGNEEEVSKR